MGQPVVDNLHKQFLGRLIGQMAGTALDSLFDGPGVGAFFQHGHIMIGFKYQTAAVF